MRSLLSILNDAGISLSSQFEQELKDIENPSTWILFLKDVTDLSKTSEALINVAKLEPLKAQQITILAHFNGEAIITQGTEEKIFELAYELKKKNIMICLKKVDNF